MKVHRFHSWDVTPAEAIQIQQQIRERVVRRGAVLDPEFVAGADAAFDIEAQRVYAAVVVLRFPSLEPVETVVTASRLSFPYIPGLLTFREAPALLRAFAKVRHDPQVVFIASRHIQNLHRHRQHRRRRHVRRDRALWNYRGLPGVRE